MKTLLRWLLWIVLAVALVLWLGSLEGRIRLEPLHGDVLSVSIGTGLVLLIAAVLLGHVLLRLTGYVIHLPERMRDWFGRRQLKQQLHDFDAAQRRFLLGDYAASARLALRAQASPQLRLAARWLELRAQALGQDAPRHSSSARPAELPSDPAAWETLLALRAACDDGYWQRAAQLLAQATVAETPWLQELRLRMQQGKLDALPALELLRGLRESGRLSEEEDLRLSEAYWRAHLRDATQMKALLKTWDKVFGDVGTSTVMRLRLCLAPHLIRRLRELGEREAAQRQAMDALGWSMTITAQSTQDQATELHGTLQQQARLLRSSLPDWDEVSDGNLQRLEQLAGLSPGSAIPTSANESVTGAAAQVLFGWVCLRQQLRGKARQALQRALRHLPGSTLTRDEAASATEAFEQFEHLDLPGLRRQALAMLAQLAEQQGEDATPYLRELGQSFALAASVSDMTTVPTKSASASIRLDKKAASLLT